MADLLKVRYEHNPDVVSRTIAGENILVPVRQQVADMAAIYVLNETAARIWELLDGRSSLEVVRDALVQEFAVDLDRAQADLLQVVSELSELHLIGPVDDDVS